MEVSFSALEPFPSDSISAVIPRADVRAVYDHAGAEELQPQEFRRAVYRAFADGVIPTGNSMTELTVTVRLTGEARYPFQFLSARDG